MKKTITFNDETELTVCLVKEIDSSKFREYINSHLYDMKEYSNGMDRIYPHRIKEYVNKYFDDLGLYVDKVHAHAHGIGNNNANYIVDVKENMYIAEMHLNDDMFGGTYLYVTDLSGNRITKSYIVNKWGMKENK